jgi:hypothetical protein
MKTTYVKVALVSCLALVLTACGQVLNPTLNTIPTPAGTQPIVESETCPVPHLGTTETEEIKQITQTTLPPFSPDLDALIGKAKQDLAQKLEISVDNITVVTVIGQEFSTDAFYCQSAKERIAKESPRAIVGQSILLSASGRRYEYHSSEQTIIFCRPLP